MSIIKFETIENKLIKYKNDWVLLDKDVATLYEIEPKKLRQHLKRNIDKFPSDYASQLSQTDLDIMVSQNVTPSKQHFGGSLPYVFTEKGETRINKVNCFTLLELELEILCVA